MRNYRAEYTPVSPALNWMIPLELLNSVLFKSVSLKTVISPYRDLAVRHDCASHRLSVYNMDYNIEY